MKTIGLVGGITWYSTLDYYRYINQLVNDRVGGDESAKVILNSVNFGEIKRLTINDDWAAIAGIIGAAAKKTENAGAECVLLCANTMHHIASEVQQAINVPLLHIADATAHEILKQGLGTVALLGTKYTMQLPFFKERLNAFGIEAIIPLAEEIEKINMAIYTELGKGIILPATKQMFLSVIDGLKSKGAGGVILGCTEIPLLINPGDCELPLFDTTFIHAAAAVNFALAQ